MVILVDALMAPFWASYITAPDDRSVVVNPATYAKAKHDSSILSKLI